MTSTAFVLVSGGIDSTTALYMAKTEFPNVVGLSADYGQRHNIEIDHAKSICSKLGVQHHILDLRGTIPKTLLTDDSADIPDTTYDKIEGKSPAYVPFRNGLLLSAATAFAVGQTDGQDDEHGIYFGAHAEDARAWAYADCTPEFIGAMANAISVGTYGKIRLHSPFQWSTKADIISLGVDQFDIDYAMTWSCYKGGTIHCGKCPTCYARKQAFIKADLVDPTRYAY